jgi:glycosyltransferase involved in cell wall biosynthesis
VLVTLIAIWWVVIYCFYSLPSDPNYALVDDERKVGRRFDLEKSDPFWIDPSQSSEKDHASLLHMPHLNFSKIVQLSQHEPLDFAERNFLSSDFDPNTDLSEAEWKAIREKVNTYGNKLLLAWPTIPVPVKGSDTRAVDAIRFLSSCGFEVDLIYWRDFASEIHNDAHDDRPERATLRNAGVQRILGPYETVKLKDSHTFVANYNVMVFWLWPHIEWLDALIEFVEHVAKTNGHTQMIAAVDDVGVAARLLQGSLLDSRDDAIEEVQRFVLRHRPFAGQFDTWNNATTILTPQHFDHDKYHYSHVLLQQEMFLYSVSDVLVGINEPTVEFLRQMAPSVPVHRLSYVSPLQPSLYRKGNKSILRNSKQFSERSGYVFFGYDNFANNAGMEWFAENVLPKLSKNHMLHIAGKVHVPSLCSCNWNKNTCSPLKSNVKCHGALSDEELDLLVASSRVAINPVREPSGVATKTCRALALGTPVVVTDMDGTFDDSYRHSKGGRRCVAEGHGCAPCFVRNLNALLSDERQWRIASDAAPLFITKHFGAGTYKRDWISIIDEITRKKEYQIILEGDADFHGWSLLSQNWHIVHTLSQQPNIKVTVVANTYNPVIPGTTHVHPWKKTERPPFPTGFHANVVIRQSWPPNFEEISDIFCGSGCRVVHILPWEFGTLPESWIPQIDGNIDWLWAPSEYNKRVFEKSGVRQANTAVVPAGVDCNSLSANFTHLKKKANDPITFLFTGGFIPRKGVDILLEEWKSVFCSVEAEELFPAARLILQTSYELGYSKSEISKFEQLIDDCGNIEWRRGWMNRGEYLAMLREGDVYIAPFRSEGFGIPIVESLFLGMSAIASVGGTAADDYMTQLASSNGEHFKKTLYPVSAHESTCTKDPCRGNSLCVFLPCRFGSCTCEKLVNEPSWFEVNRDDLRKQMVQVYKDIVSYREKVSHLSYENFLTFAGLHTETLDNDAKSFCWSKLGYKYANAIMTVMNSPIRRTIPAFERSALIQTPPMIIWVRLSMKYISRNVAKILLWSLPLAVFVLTAFIFTGKKKNMKDH